MKLFGVLELKEELITTTPPTKTGYYYAKYGGDEGNEMQAVEVIRDARSGKNVVRMNNVWYELSCFTHWLGPIYETHD